MSVGAIKHDTPVDLVEAERSGKRSDVGLLVISFLYILNISLSIFFVWHNNYSKSNIWINVCVLLENIFVMTLVVIFFNKYKY